MTGMSEEALAMKHFGPKPEKLSERIDKYAKSQEMVMILGEVIHLESTNTDLLTVVKDCVNFLADLNLTSPEGSIYFDSEYMTRRARALHKRAYTVHSKAKEKRL